MQVTIVLRAIGTAYTWMLEFMDGRTIGCNGRAERTENHAIRRARTIARKHGYVVVGVCVR